MGAVENGIYRAAGAWLCEPAAGLAIQECGWGWAVLAITALERRDQAAGLGTRADVGSYLPAQVFLGAGSWRTGEELRGLQCSRTAITIMPARGSVSCRAGERTRSGWSLQPRAASALTELHLV